MTILLLCGFFTFFIPGAHFDSYQVSIKKHCEYSKGIVWWSCSKPYKVGLSILQIELSLDKQRKMTQGIVI